MSDIDGQKVRWAEYIKELYMVNPQSQQLPTSGLRIVNADSLINERLPSLYEVGEDVEKLMAGKAIAIYTISAKHAVLTATLFDWKRGQVVRKWKGRENRYDRIN